MTDSGAGFCTVFTFSLLFAGRIGYTNSNYSLSGGLNQRNQPSKTTVIARSA